MTLPAPVRHPVDLSRAATDAAVRVASSALLAAALGLVTFWWGADGGLADLGGWGTGLESLGRLTGLVASVLLLAQVVLMARVPVLEAAYGQDRLVRVHRLVGFTSFNLMLAHIALISWGYAAGRLVDTPATFWQLTTDYPGMLLAVAGTGCLLMAVVTSVRAARRRLRYESWHLLHLYAYLGVGLALPHQLWTGSQFTASAARTVFWWGLWIAAALAVVVFRLGVPVARNLRHRLRVTSVVRQDDGVVSVYVAGRDLHALRVQPGQFFTWRFLGRVGWSRANPYSLSSAPDGRSLRITVADAGDGSAAVAALRPGTAVIVEGPFGRLSPRARTCRKVALIGAGVGITPLRSLAEGLDYAPGEAVLLQRFTRRPLFDRELRVLAHERGLDLVHLPGRRRHPDSWLGEDAGSIDDVGALLAWVPDLAERDVYVCGPDGWSDSVVRACLAAGVPEHHLHTETFRW